MNTNMNESGQLVGRGADEKSVVDNPVALENVNVDKLNPQVSWQEFIQDVGRDKIKTLIGLLENSAADQSAEQADLSRQIAALLKDKLQITDQ